MVITQQLYINLFCLPDDSEDMGGKSKELGLQSADYEPEGEYESVSQLTFLRIILLTRFRSDGSAKEGSHSWLRVK